MRLFGAKKNINIRKKIFCIGLNKTGTTSLEQALQTLGFRLGWQSEAEMLLEDYAKRDFRKIVKYCKTAEAFQDIPFSLDYTYQIMDFVFPGSRFILTMRDSPDIWYESLLNFHSKMTGKNHTPTAEDLKEVTYRYKGWLWRCHEIIFGADEETVFDKRLYLKVYERHNEQIMDYFKYRPEDLLVLHISHPSAMKQLCDFLGLEYQGQSFPHLLKTKEVCSELKHQQTQSQG